MSDRNARSSAVSVVGHAWPRVKAIASSDLFWIVLIAGLSLLFYVRMLNDWFQTDDFLFLRASNFIGPLGSVSEAFDFTGFDKHLAYIDFIRDDDIALPFLAFRPFYFVGLEAMYLAFGENPLGYHAVSLGIHLVNVYLVWRIATRLVQGSVGPRLAALFFAIHPVYLIAVSWISDVGTPASTLMALGAVLLFVKSIECKPLHLAWYLAALALYTSSLFFHAQTISWVAMMAAFYFLMDRDRFARVLRPKSWVVILPFAAVAAAVYQLQAWIVETYTPVQQGFYHFGPHMLTHFKNLASAFLFPFGGNQPSEAHFAAFVALLILIAVLPVLDFARRRSLLPPFPHLVAIVWFLAAVAPLLTPDGFFFVGVLNRKAYVAGPSFAIMVVLLGTWLIDLVPPRAQVLAQAAAALLVVVALLGAFKASSDGISSFAVGGWESERFVMQLQEEYPSLPEGGTLYVVNAPFSMRLFGDNYLVAAVKAFYGKVDAYNVTGEQADELEMMLGERDRIFRYKISLN